MVSIPEVKEAIPIGTAPSQNRYGAHVASQRCTILRDGKAIILSWNAQLMSTLKTHIVLDMGYTLPEADMFILAS